LAKIPIFVLLSVVLGCGGKSGSGPSSSTEAEHIGKVGKLLTEYLSSHMGTDLLDIEELKKWAIAQEKADESDFISTRDKKPYVLEPMAMGGMPPPGVKLGRVRMPLILHEEQGKNGTKFAVPGNAMVGSEMTDQALKTLTHGREVN
jgi:hypothetical protein